MYLLIIYKAHNEYILFLSKFKELSNYTYGKNIILSNGSRKNEMFTRPPNDIINISCFIGLTLKKAENMIKNNILDCIRHGEFRRTIKSTIKIDIEENFEINEDELEDNEIHSFNEENIVTKKFLEKYDFNISSDEIKNEDIIDDEENIDEEK
jgi:hypothetical protein